MPDVASEISHSDIQTKLAQVLAVNEKISTERDEFKRERDEYKRLYLSMLELCKKLERGILNQSRERFVGNDMQLSLSILGALAGNAEDVTAPIVENVREHQRHKPTGRKPLPETLPRVDIEVLPPEVQQKGLEAFEKIGEDVAETVEKRPASLVVVRIHKPKFVLKERDRLEDTQVLQAPSPELPIERGLAGPSLLADTIVNRWENHLPLYRLERVYGRQGMELSRSTICAWHFQLAQMVKPLIDAMWADAYAAPYLCMDATGVLVQAKEKCKHGHFWVVAAPEKHVLFGYSEKHDGKATDVLLKNYKGYLVADAHAVFDHLYSNGDIIESGCWSHCRRYFFKALLSDDTRAKHALALIGGLFQIERENATSPPERRLEIRKEKSKPILDAFFSWCDLQSAHVLDQTPISKAIGYARNQRQALQRFLEDGRLPIHNNFSERALRREALGRKNWLFLGSDEAGPVNATFVSLLASCQLHAIEPYSYLRDLFCLLPSWNHKRVLELAPLHWKKTLQQPDTQQRLAANVFRQISLGTLNHSEKK